MRSYEFEEHGCRLKALNDRGDETPEGEFTDGILDQLAKYEQAKTAERTRRGKLKKARGQDLGHQQRRLRVPLQRYPRRLPRG